MEEGIKVGVVGSGAEHIKIAEQLLEDGIQPVQEINLDLLGGMDIEYTTPEHEAKKALAERAANMEPTAEELVMKELMPESGMIEDFQFGPPFRLKGETLEHYHIRQKIDRKVYALRQKGGLNSWDAKKGQFTDPMKQIKKQNRKLKSINRTRLSRAQRREMGTL